MGIEQYMEDEDYEAVKDFCLLSLQGKYFA